MPLNDNYDALKNEMTDIINSYTTMFLLGREAILRDNENAKTLFLDATDFELEKRLAHPFVTKIKSQVQETLGGASLESFTVMKQTSDLLFLLLEKSVNKEIGKRDLRKIYMLLENKGISFFQRQDSQDILDAILNHINRGEIK